MRHILSTSAWSSNEFHYKVWFVLIMPAERRVMTQWGTENLYATNAKWNMPYPVTSLLNSLWPSNNIWWHISGSKLAQVMACCLKAQSHYLRQCWHHQRWSVLQTWEQFHRKCSKTFSVTCVQKLHFWICFHIPLEAMSLTHWGRDKMDAISQTTLSIAFSWMKIYEFRLNFRWSLFLRVQLTIFQHWFR